jgi:hypothetical protein
MAVAVCWSILFTAAVQFVDSVPDPLDVRLKPFASRNRAAGAEQVHGSRGAPLLVAHVPEHLIWLSFKVLDRNMLPKQFLQVVEADIVRRLEIELRFRIKPKVLFPEGADIM